MPQPGEPEPAGPGRAARSRWAGSGSPQVRRAAVTLVFAVLGTSEGTWAARIPAIKAGLHLSPGMLGLALLGPALGCVLAMPPAGAVLASVAPRRVSQLALIMLAALLPVTTVAGSAVQLFFVLAGWGAGIGVLDVAMNTEAAAVQDQSGRRLMSGFHGAYSVGGLVGAGLGAVAAAAGVGVRETFVIAAVVMAAAGLAGTRAFAAGPAHHAAPQPGTDGEPAAGEPAAGEPAAGNARPHRWPKWSWALVALGAMSFASFLGEGSASNWSAVYLHSSLGASPALAALGFTLFASAMAAGRLSGDWLANRAGPVRLVRLSAGLATVGFGGALLIGHLWSGLAGFALLGAGLSVVVPLAFTGAAGLGRPGPNLAMVTTCGYLGSLAGPPLIGGIADVTGLPAALGVVVILAGLITVLAGAVRPRPPATGPPEARQAGIGRPAGFVNNGPVSIQGTDAYRDLRDLPPLVEQAVTAARRGGFRKSCLPSHGRLLQLLAGGIGDGVIGETGTGCGVGLAWLASGARTGVRLVSIENDWLLADAARAVFGGVPAVSVLHGDWAELHAAGPFDLLVLDGGGQGKASEPPVSPREWLRPGGIIVMDDFTPSQTWPPMHDGRPDRSRLYWLEHPDLLATEIRTEPGAASIVATLKHW